MEVSNEWPPSVSYAVNRPTSRFLLTQLSEIVFPKVPSFLTINQTGDIRAANNYRPLIPLFSWFASHNASNSCARSILEWPFEGATNRSTGITAPGLSGCAGARTTSRVKAIASLVLTRASLLPMLSQIARPRRFRASCATSSCSAFSRWPLMLVPRKIFTEHAHGLGDSGSGKTSLFLCPLIEQLVMSGDCSVIVIDLSHRVR